MEILDIIIYILSSAIIITWIIFWVKTKSILGIFGVTNTSNIQPPTTPTPTTLTPTTTKSPMCNSANCNSITGKCVNDKCICDPGYDGYNCSHAIQCLNGCYGHGACVLGKCVCNTEWIGEDCSIRNVNWNNKIYSSDLICKINDNACPPGKCCQNEKCVDCNNDMILQYNGTFDGQEPKCPLISNNYCKKDADCRYNGVCTKNGFYALTNNVLETKLLYSTNGLNWEEKKPLQIKEFLYGTSNSTKLCYNGILWVLISENISFSTDYKLIGSIYSTDLINWNISTGDTVVLSSNIIYNKNKNIWIICGGSISYGPEMTTMVYSKDGKNWTKTDKIFGFANDISYNNDIFVAVGSKINTNEYPDHTIAWSSDGINWVGLGLVFSSKGSLVLWNETQKLWVAFGKDTSDNTQMAWSLDGKNWTLSVSGDIFGNYNVNTYDTNYPINCDSKGITATIKDTPKTIISYADSQTDAYTKNISKDECGGNCLSYYCVDRTTKTIYTNGIQYMGGLLYYNSPNSTANLLGTDTDLYKKIACVGGESCRVISSTVIKPSNPKAIFCNGSIWVAGGEGKNILIYSTDGKVWKNTLPLGNIFNIFAPSSKYSNYKPENGMVKSISYNGNTWFAVGAGYEGIAYNIATSNDGINWISLPNSGTNYKDITDLKWYSEVVV